MARNKTDKSNSTPRPAWSGRILKPEPKGRSETTLTEIRMAISRNAATGKLTTVGEVRGHPKTQVVEHMPKSNRAKGRDERNSAVPQSRPKKKR